MERENALKALPGEIEMLAKMHILYGMQFTAPFEAQKKKVEKLVADCRINPNHDLDPISRNLYRRYL